MVKAWKKCERKCQSQLRFATDKKTNLDKRDIVLEIWDDLTASYGFRSARSLVRESDLREELTDRAWVLRVMQPKTSKLYELSLIMPDKVYI